MLYKVLTEILLQVTCHNMYTVQQDVVIMSQAEKILIREYLILSHLYKSTVLLDSHYMHDTTRCH